MLILSRKSGESVVVAGDIVIKVIRVEGDVVKLGVEAPADISIFRQEIYDEIQRSNREAIRHGRQSVPKLPRPQAKADSSAAACVQTAGAAADPSGKSRE